MDLDSNHARQGHLFEQSTWRLRLGKNQKEPNKDIWATSVMMSNGKSRIYYYEHATGSKRAKPDELDLSTVNHDLLSDSGHFSTMKTHLVWSRHFQYELQYAELTQITWNEFMARVSNGEDPSDIKKELNLRAPNKKNNGRTIPQGSREDSEEPNRKRPKIYDEASCQRIFEAAYDRTLTEDELGAIQQRFMKDCTPQIEILLRYFVVAMEYQRIGKIPFWCVQTLIEYMANNGIVVAEDPMVFGGMVDDSQQNTTAGADGVSVGGVAKSKQKSENELALEMDNSLTRLLAGLSSLYKAAEVLNAQKVGHI